MGMPYRVSMALLAVLEGLAAGKPVVEVAADTGITIPVVAVVFDRHGGDPRRLMVAATDLKGRIDDYRIRILIAWCLNDFDREVGVPESDLPGPARKASDELDQILADEVEA